MALKPQKHIKGNVPPPPSPLSPPPPLSICPHTLFGVAGLHYAQLQVTS